MPSPDFGDPEVRERYEVARRAAQAAAFACRVRCCATTRLGLQCGQAVVPGRTYCWLHGGRRLADYIEPKDRAGRAKRSPIVQRPERQHAARMKAQWKHDPFVKGFTVLLDADGCRRRDEWLKANGLVLGHMAPATLDKASWKAYVLARSGVDFPGDQRAEVIAQRLRAEDDALGDDPAPGRHADLTRASQAAAWRKSLRPPPPGANWRSPVGRKPVRALAVAERQRALDWALLASQPQTQAEALKRELARDRLHAAGLLGSD